MRQLIYYELRKLLQRRLVLAGLLCLLVLNLLLLTSTVNEQCAYDATTGREAHGLAAIQLEKEIVARYGNVLHDETVQQMLTDFQPSAEFLERTHGISMAYVHQNSVQAAVHYYFANADGSWNGKTVAEVFGTTPLTIGYTDGWLCFSRLLIRLLLFTALLLIVILAPIFSAEYSGMDQLLFTSRYGRSKCCTAKIATAFLIAIVLTTAVLALNLLLAYLVLGRQGFDCSILFSGSTYREQGIPFPITCRTMLRYQILLAFTAVLALTGIVLWLSAHCKSSITALVSALALFLFPVLVPISETSPLFRFIVLLPLYHIQFYALMSVAQWSNGLLYASLAIPVALLLAVVGTFLAKKRFSEHQIT